MNKTVNINLAGIFFHIDEDAYLKLQRYLEAIKRSFTNTQGQSEIIADIEARIAELFNERVQNTKQVIGIKEVDEVISIMGQPEDYLVDDEIFEDDPETTFKSRTTHTSSKKLFRDTDNSYIGGVSSGIGHYFGIDTIWIRLSWVILFSAAGTGVLLYILLWILVPEAKTTAEKIMMTGEPVNISNIEKKIKDGFENVSETVSDVAKNVTESVSDAAKNVSDAAKKVNFQKQGNKIKSSSKTFFDTLAEVFMFFLKVFAKFVGALFILIGAITLIALIIGLLSVGIADIIHIPGVDLINIVNAGNTPVWVATILVLFAIGIPFFFLFYLGLKILVNNLKSIGNIAKFTLLGLWLFSIIGLVIIGLREASEHAYNERVVERQNINIRKPDTLNVAMLDNDIFRNSFIRNDFKVTTNDEGYKTIYRSDILLYLKSTTDSVAKIRVEKSADGSSFERAMIRAKNINYDYSMSDNKIVFDSYLSTNHEHKFSDQEINITLYLPEGSTVKLDESTRHFLSYFNKIPSEYIGHYLEVTPDGFTCSTCETDFEVNVDTPHMKIDDNGIDIKSENNSLKINKNGIKAESENVKVNIDSTGIKIKSEN